jgi:hypothetical protein
LTKWQQHELDTRIAALMQTPAAETIGQQRNRCAEYGCLVLRRSRDLGHDAYALAIKAEHGKPCYTDGSALRADEWAKQFLEGGTEWLWPALEREYAERFPTLAISKVPE